MQMIREKLAMPLLAEGDIRIRIPVDRLTLAKRRWRGVAEDGREFGFEVEKPLVDGDAVWAEGEARYFISQKYEPVLELAIAAAGLDATTTAARVGWMIGNLHFQIEITAEVLRVGDDPALRQLFEREGLAYRVAKRVFRPLAGGHHH
jgi:urease accessory protein